MHEVYLNPGQEYVFMQILCVSKCKTGALHLIKLVFAVSLIRMILVFVQSETVGIFLGEPLVQIPSFFDLLSDRTNFLEVEAGES